MTAQDDTVDQIWQATYEERREALRGLLPGVERLRGVREVAWSGVGVTEDGTCTISYPLYDRDTLEVLAVCGGGALTRFGYLDALEERGLGDSPVDLRALASDADEDLTLTLLTWLVRGERFCDGLVAEAIRDGTLVALLDRLRELYRL